MALSPMPSMASALEGPVSLNYWTLSMCGTSQWRTGSPLMCCSWTCLRPSIESLTCAKLRMMGIDGDILSWLRDNLSSRRQRCIVEGCASGWLPVSSGVPQGTIPGPSQAPRSHPHFKAVLELSYRQNGCKG